MITEKIIRNLKKQLLDQINELWKFTGYKANILYTKTNYTLKYQQQFHYNNAEIDFEKKFQDTQKSFKNQLFKGTQGWKT